MIQVNQPLFQRFGTLRTWIVGVQYYEGAARLSGQEVFFDREPDNPFDPNAVAVFTRDGSQIGHLPRHDARYFSALMLEGALALTGRVTGSVEGGRMPLLLEVHATSQLSSILMPDERDDWRAICHNLFAGVWGRLDAYSADTLSRLRDRVRELGHDEELYPKTQFLYRMLKAVEAARGEQEQVAFRQHTREAVEAMAFGPPRGWPELAVLSLDAGSGFVQQQADAQAASGALTCKDDLSPEVIRALPLRCPYPPSAHGLAVFVCGELHAANWFHDAESAQVLWYPVILDALEAARDAEETKDCILTPDQAKACVLETLASACFTLEAGGTPLGEKATFRSGSFEGSVTLRDGQLLHLRMRLNDHIVYAPQAKLPAKGRLPPPAAGKDAG